MTRLRFAHDPAASLTVGGLRVALANALFQGRHGGTLLLRLEDRHPRAQPEADGPLVQDLRWAGIRCDAVIRQSARSPLYARAIERLQRERLAYPCFESGDELRVKEALRRRRGQSPIYDRAMLSLTDGQRRAAEAKGKRPYWRLKLSGRTMAWNDGIQGRRHADLSMVSDPVLVGADGSPTPLLASAVDDLDTGITHIVRTEEAAGDVAIQIELFELLGGSPARRVCFAHLPGLGGTESARLGGLPVRSLRGDGIEAPAIVSCLTGEPPLPLAELAGRIELDRFKEAKLDVGRMLAANRDILRRTEFSAVADRLPAGATETFWQAVRGGIDLLKEARGWWDVVAGTIVPPVIAGAHRVLTTAAALLPAEPWDGSVCQRWLSLLEDATRQTGEELLPLLRLALTGEESGPDLAVLLPLIGRSRAVSRLTIAAA